MSKSQCVPNQPFFLHTLDVQCSLHLVAQVRNLGAILDFSLYSRPVIFSLSFPITQITHPILLFQFFCSWMASECEGCLCDMVALRLCVSLDHGCLSLLVLTFGTHPFTPRASLSVAAEACCGPHLTRLNAVPSLSSPQRHIWCTQLVSCPLRGPGFSNSFPYTMLGCKGLCENPQALCSPPVWIIADHSPAEVDSGCCLMFTVIQVVREARQ